MPPSSAPSTTAPHGPSRWWAVAAALVLIAGLWWTRPQREPVMTPAGVSSAATTPAPDAPATASLPAVTLSLSPRPAGSPDGPVTAAVPRGTAQVLLRLAGDLPGADDLTAEITSLERDEVRRWPVDDAPAGPDGATRLVAVPPYALPGGDFVLTLWVGDADVVQRYAFRIDAR